MNKIKIILYSNQREGKIQDPTTIKVSCLIFSFSSSLFVAATAVGFALVSNAMLPALLPALVDLPSPFP